MPERFTPEEIKSLIPAAEANERRQRAMTGGEASEDTSKIFDDQERARIIREANPTNPTQAEVEERDMQLAQYIRGQEAAQEARRIAGVPELPQEEIERRISAMRERMHRIDPTFSAQEDATKDDK
jgi:hypothetical protein